MSEGVSVAREVLDVAGVEYVLVDARATVRTLVLNDGDVLRLVVIPAGEQLDLERARRALRADRGLRLATDAEVAEDFPAFAPDALPPLGHEAVPELIDLGLLYLDALVLDGGVRIDPRDLLRLCEPRVADVCVSPRTGGRSLPSSGRRPPSA
jgi:prolyl-tRNA editing enzyme YbaK/EbsC (Cys-tRNA(Pro) deacylase)